MGQNLSCSTSNSAPQIVYEQKPKRPDIRRSMNPLQYISAKPLLGQQSLAILPELQKDRQEDIGEQQQQQKQNLDPVNQSQINENISQQPQEILYKKVEVKWNKFIKMKRKNFLSDYSVVREVGRGGFGCVYKVAMKNSNIFRAAKKIQKKDLKKDQHQNLLAQMAIMMHMDHPNITKLYQVYDQKTKYILILQLCQGGQLFDRIAKKSISESDAQCIIRQVLSALHYMHSKGIVHRDIKPQNMLFQKKTKLIKIIDFGISCKLERSGFLTTRVGTPYYIAPEVLARRYNEKCDIWSLGVVLYMMMYNVPPYKGQNPMQVMQSVIKDQIVLKNPIHYNYSVHSLDFLRRLLCRNFSKRPSAKQALQHRWLHQKIQLNIDQKNESDRILQRMTKFHFKNKLEAVVYTYIVSQLLNSQQKLQILSVFKMLDTNNNGIIEIEELKKVLDEKNFNLSEDKIKIIRDYLDTNCSGYIDYTQFVVGALDSQKIQHKHFEQAFSYFDIDNSGEITFQQVAKFLQSQATTQEQIRQLFKQVDKNGDGVISKIQFVQLLANKKLEEYK